jgi:two-component system nitrate/nitrite response regulator NarL
MDILVVDDHALFRDGLINLLKAGDFTIAGQVGDGESAVREVARLKPDLVLMDINLPGISGLEALRMIKDLDPEQKVVMLTVSENDDYLIEAVKSGASGYLLKTLDSDGLLASLWGVERGEMAISRRATTRVIDGLVALIQGQAQATQQILTPRENELLGHVAEGHSNRDIAEILSVSENTVKYHMRQILRRLDVSNRTEAVTEAIRIGILDTESWV